MNLNYRNPDKINDYQIKCWGFVTNFWEKFFLLYVTIHTDEMQHCGVPCGAVHNTISYSNDCGNYLRGV